MTKINKETQEKVAKLQATGLNAAKIAETVGEHPATIRYWLRKFGALEPTNLAEKIRQLRRQGSTYKEISKQTGIPMGSIGSHLQLNAGKHKSITKRQLPTTTKIGNWGKPNYVKVLIQQFEGGELVEPNNHYSKCFMLYNTIPSEVFDLIVRLLRKEGVNI